MCLFVHTLQLNKLRLPMGKLSKPSLQKMLLQFLKKPLSAEINLPGNL